MLFTNLNAPSPRLVARHSRGFGLLQVLLLISVMAGLAAMGYLQWRARALVDASRQEHQALAQANQAIIAFATVARRLPCPDTDRDGAEDCGTPADQKGWLPSATLRLAGADPGVGVGQLRYLVQRGAGANDLTVLSDAWQPLEYDEGGKTFSNMRAVGYAGASIQTLTDLCQRLETARTTPLDAALARVNAAPIRTVAYALAHPGSDDADGDGDLFDGANANTGANASLMEDPARRPVLATYNDMVLERSFASLQSDLQCQLLMDSINTVALGHDVVVQVAEMRDDNISSATRAVAFATLAAVMTGLEIALTVAEGISDAGNAAVEWIACAASLGLAVNACAAAPQHTAAIGLAGGVVAANIVAVGLNATAAAAAGAALILASNTATPAQACPARDTTLITGALASAKAELTAATTARAAVQTEITNKTTERNAAIVARDSATATLRSVIRGTGASSSIDYLVDPLLNATGTWGDASYTLELANSQLSRATDEKNQWATEVAKYNSMLAADSTTVIAGLNADITSLNAQIATAEAANPVTAADLEALRLLKGRRDGKKADIQLVQSTADITRLNNEIAALDAQIATNPPNKADLQAQRERKLKELQGNLFKNAQDKAIASQAAAQTALNTATATKNAASTSYNTAQTNYQTAYNNLAGSAGRYAIYNGTGAVIGYRCTTGCAVGEVSVLSYFSSALVDLFGTSASTSPNVDAKYLKPVKLQKELDALNAKLTAAQARETQALNQRDQLQLMVDNPASCNVSGSAVIPMTPAEAESILANVDRKGGTR